MCKFDLILCENLCVSIRKYIHCTPRYVHVTREEDHGHEDRREELLGALQVGGVRPDDEAEEGAHARGEREDEEVPKELGGGEVEPDEEEDEQGLHELVGGGEQEG